MLQKIFRRGRNTFGRSSMKDESSRSFRKQKLFHSKSLDEGTGEYRSNPTSPMKTQSLNRPVVNGDSRRAPMAGKEDSFECDPSKKVKFKESASPDETLDNISHEALFDDGVLKAFEVGSLSIKEFLESPHSSPETTPDTTLVKRRKNSHEKLTSSQSKSLPSSPHKKPTLLDQAHAKACSNSDRLPASPALRKQIILRRSSTEQTTQAPKSNGRTSHRFSKSIENLAQQVFGDEFEKHLERASNLNEKVPLCEFEKQRDMKPTIKRSKSISPRTNDDQGCVQLQKVCPKTEPVVRKVQVKVSNNGRKGIQRCHSATRQCEMKLAHTVNTDIARSVDFPSPDEEPDTLESWSNKLDLTSRTSSLSCEVNGIRSKMLPVIEGQVMTSPTKLTVHERQRAKSDGFVCSPRQSKHLHLRHHLIKSDSNAAEFGSEVDLSTNQTTVLDINFPPPPPVNAIDSESEAQEQFISYDWVIEDLPATENPELDMPNDPLVEALLSIVPLPEDPAKLTAALSSALSEIVSEIISSRQKLNRILKAIEIHQQILKDQSKQISTQARQIAQLRFIAWELNTANTPSAVKLRRGVERKSKRPQSARTYRQSREMVELTNVLDDLLDQCSSMQIDSDVATKQLRNSNQVKRSNTFPSREHVQTLKRIESTNDSD